MPVAHLKIIVLQTLNIQRRIVNLAFGKAVQYYSKGEENEKQ